MFIAQSTSNDSAGALMVLLFVVLGILALGVYLIPSVIAIMRKVPNVGSVVIINVLLGWILIGWVVALAMAFRSRATPTQVVVQNSPAPQAAPAPPAAPTGHPPVHSPQSSTTHAPEPSEANRGEGQS